MSANPVFVALDTTDLDYARELAERVRPDIGGLKLGLEFFSAHGPQGVRGFEGCGLPIFLDLKFHDIPNTVAGACRAAAQLGVSIMNVHAQGGAAMMRAAVEAAKSAQFDAMTVGQRLGDAVQYRRDDAFHIAVVKMRISRGQPRHQFRLNHPCPLRDTLTV